VIAIRINTAEARRDAAREGLLPQIFGVQGQRNEQQESANRALQLGSDIVFSGPKAISGMAIDCYAGCLWDMTYDVFNGLNVGDFSPDSG